MSKAWKYVALGAAVAATLVPYKVKVDDEAGEFEYRSFLLGIHKKENAETGDSSVSISFFNLPKRKKKAEADPVDVVDEDEDVLILDESELATPAEPEAAAEEAPAEEAPEAPTEEA